MSEISVGLGPDNATAYYDLIATQDLGGWGATQLGERPPNLNYHAHEELQMGVAAVLTGPDVPTTPLFQEPMPLFDKFGDPVLSFSQPRTTILSPEGLST